MDAAPLIGPRRTRLEISPWGGVPPDQDRWRALGECIGRHEHLQKLIFEFINATHEGLGALLTGLNQNRSVRDLKFCLCNGEWPLGILTTFFRDNQNLRWIDADQCDEGIITSLSGALRSSTPRSIGQISCVTNENKVGDEAIAEFIESLAGLPQLWMLDFGGCVSVGRRGSGALASLLRSPACILQKIALGCSNIYDESLALLEPAVAACGTLRELHLWRMDSISVAALQSFAHVLRSPTCMLELVHIGKNIGDDEMIAFADVLATNPRVEDLSFGWRSNISEIGLSSMTRALCNTFNISCVYSSNHTLRDLHLGCMSRLPSDLQNYLRMNEGEDKSLVAREKIFMHFFEGDFSMEPFRKKNMPSNIYPPLLAWIGRTLNEESFTALFHFLRTMPPLWGNCCPALRHSGMKRKVRS